MAIFSGSRYAGIAFTVTTESDGLIIKSFMHIPAPSGERGRSEFILRDGENLETLAYSRGRDARKWWLLATVNDLEWPLDVPTGTKLSMPF
jgi:hypothetical protein